LIIGLLYEMFIKKNFAFHCCRQTQTRKEELLRSKDKTKHSAHLAFPPKAKVNKNTWQVFWLSRSPDTFPFYFAEQWLIFPETLI